MHISSQRVGDDQFTYQLQITVNIGLPVELRVVFSSVTRFETGVEIFDQFGASMGRRDHLYGMNINHFLVTDLNVLLEEFDVQLLPEEFRQISYDAYRLCDGRYGRGIYGGDAVITIK